MTHLNRIRVWPSEVLRGRRRSTMARAAALASAVLAALGLGGRALAQQGEGVANKKITWTTKTPDADAKGEFHWLALIAGASHDAASPPPPPACFVSANIPAGFAEWTLANPGGGLPPKETGLQDCGACLAQARLSVTISAPTPHPTEPGKSNITTILNGSTSALTCLSPAPKQAAAARAKGRVRIKGAKASYVPAADRTGKAKPVNKLTEVDLESSQTTKWHDPVTLEFYQEGGGLVASQVLYTLDVESANVATLNMGRRGGARHTGRSCPGRATACSPSSSKACTRPATGVTGRRWCSRLRLRWRGWRPGSPWRPIRSGWSSRSR